MKLIVVLIAILEIIFYSITIPKDNYIKAKSKYKWMTTESLYREIETAAREYGLDELLVCSVIHHESLGYKYAISEAGARGYMQVMPVHLPIEKIEKVYMLYATKLNLTLGCSYLKFCLRLAAGNKIDALRMYNAGHFSNASRYKNWSYVYNIIANSIID